MGSNSCMYGIATSIPVRIQDDNVTYKAQQGRAYHDTGRIRLGCSSPRLLPGGTGYVGPGSIDRMRGRATCRMGWGHPGIHLFSTVLAGPSSSRSKRSSYSLPLCTWGIISMHIVESNSAELGKGPHTTFPRRVVERKVGYAVLVTPPRVARRCWCSLLPMVEVS